MALGKQTPRQRLIGLMYLIFLALMALNVSVDVLDSFPLINKGIEETNRNFEMKVGMVYDDFREQELLFSAQHVYPFHDQALHVKALADSLVNYIITNRTLMLAQVNGISFEEAQVLDLQDSRRKDDYSRSSNFWLEEGGSDGGAGSRAYVLRSMIENFKNEIDSILATHNQAITLGLDVEGPFYVQDRPVSWQIFNFDRVISVAVATNLNRMVTEVRNAEFDAISMLYDLITEGTFRFDEIAARVVPKSQIVMEGDYYEAEIFVAAYDTRQDPEVIVDGIGRLPVSGGVGRLRVPARSPGTKRHTGVIRMTSPAGVVEEHRFVTTYTVERPTATVSADKMNVFYIGVDNPVSISAPGVPTENLRPRISAGATLRRVDNGNYVVTLEPGTRDVVITVNALVGDEIRNMGENRFRGRTIPDPVAYIAGRREGRMDRQVLARAGRITAQMEAFDFDARFNIASFRMTTTIAGEYRSYPATGNTFTEDMIRVIESARGGQEITFRDIITERGPDGTVRNLGAIAFTIN
ncbi:MAG: gliding motility protein GldM [Bacteroidales bacterium]|nr:gliding motility protein GldM [Bacteroidales bacterium]